MSVSEPPESDPSPAPPGLAGRVYAFFSLLIAMASLGLAFLPWGYGFITVFLAAVGVILGGKSARYGSPRLGRWASRANMVPVLVYVIYMVSYMPEGSTTHTFEATVVEAGELVDQSVFDEKVQAAGKISGLRLKVSPCENEFIIRVTGLPNSHLGLYVPTKPTRECLAEIRTGQTFSIEVVSTERTITGSVKGYRFQQIGPCALEDVDMGAIVKGTTCPSWF